MNGDRVITRQRVEAILDFIQLSSAELKTIERSHRRISRISC